MAVVWSVTLWMAKMIWLALSGWVVVCLSVADEIASALRTGDIGPFHPPTSMIRRTLGHCCCSGYPEIGYDQMEATIIFFCKASKKRDAKNSGTLLLLRIFRNWI